MKRKLIVLFASIVLIINTFSVNVWAVKNAEYITSPMSIEEAAPEKLTDSISNENALNNGSVPSTPSSMVVHKTDITSNICVTLDNLLDNEYVVQFEMERKYPFIIDLSSYDNTMDSIMFPDELLDILIIKEKSMTDVADADNSVETDKEVDSNIDEEKTGDKTEPINVQDNFSSDNTNKLIGIQTDDIVLKVITKNAEYSWKSSSLENAENINGFLKLRCALADHTSQHKIEETDAPRNKSDLKFIPSDEKNRGILFVSKDDTGYWDITSEYLFGSIATYVISIIFLVVLTFALIIAINLIIIKIYKIKK